MLIDLNKPFVATLKLVCVGMLFIFDSFDQIL